MLKLKLGSIISCKGSALRPELKIQEVERNWPCQIRREAIQILSQRDIWETHAEPQKFLILSTLEFFL